MSRERPIGPLGPVVVDPLRLSLREEEVWRFLSYPEATEPPALTRARILREIAVARDLIGPRGIYRVDPAAEAARCGLSPPDVGAGRSASRGARAAWTVLGLVTIGARLEEAVRHRLAGADATGALLLDAVGSAAAEEAADRLSDEIVGARAEAGLPDSGSGGFRGRRVSPGYGDWPLAAQSRVFARLPHDAIQVHLLDSLLMVPRKSISFALWLDGDGHPLDDVAGCARCPDRRCRLRRSPRPGMPRPHTGEEP